MEKDTTKVGATKEEQSSLSDFKWDETGDFFGISTNEEEGEPVERLKADDEGDEPLFSDDDDDSEEPSGEEDKETEKEKKTDEKSEEPFKESDEDEPETGTKDKGEDDKFFSTLALEMKEKGIFQNLELKEGEEVDEERFFKLQDEEIESRVEETFEAFFEELDEEAKAFLKFKKGGGSTAQFMQVYGNSVDISSLDINEDSDQDKIIRYYSATVEKMDEDEINDRLEWLKDNGRKKAYAKRYSEKIEQTEQQAKEELIRKVEQSQEKRERESQEFNERLQKQLESTEAVGNFDFTKINKKELMSYISKPTVKIGKNKYITQFQADLGGIFKGEGEQTKKLLLLANLVKSDFDVNGVITETKTKVIKAAKSKLQQIKSGSVKASGSGGYRRKSLSDFF